MKRLPVRPDIKRPRRRSSAKPDTGATLLEKGGEVFLRELLRLIQLTDSVPTAAETLEVDYTAVYDWIKRGEGHLQLGKTGTIFAKLAKGVKKARASFVVDNLLIIRRAAAGLAAKPAEYDARGKLVKAAEPAERKQWQAAAWTLERRRPEFRLNDKASAAATGTGGGGPVEVRFVEEPYVEPAAEEKVQERAAPAAPPPEDDEE